MLRRAPWTIGVTLAAIAATAVALWLAPGGPLALALRGDAGAIGEGQIWRLVTGPLLHTSGEHLVWDVTMLATIGILYERDLGATFPSLVIAGLAVPASATLLAHPELEGYAGLSGLSYALAAAAVTFELGQGKRAQYALVAGAVLVFKTARELMGAGALLFEVDHAPGVQPMPVAHLAGMSLAVIVVVTRRPWRSARRTSAQLSVVDHEHRVFEA